MQVVCNFIYISTSEMPCIDNKTSLQNDSWEGRRVKMNHGSINERKDTRYSVEAEWVF